MNAMMEIRLSDLRCHAHHGVHDSERRMGQEFRTDITLSYPAKGMVTQIGQTIDYTVIYAIFRQTMAEAEDLLETVAMKLSERIRTAFPHISEINISIEKTSPPIPTFEGRVGIAYRRKFDME
ncbi:MAG: dihydroneopterin aldolase [Chitinophagia bacterium]|nr:dihydroneopterin aldolase [Chitinophagia bacterium]